MSIDVDGGGDDAPSRARDRYVPFKDRFRAWWNGTDGDTREREFADNTIDTSDADDREDESPWSPARLRAIEAVWGDGFLHPGGKRYARKLLAVMAPSSKMSVLDLTAALGGTARALAEQHNLWMDALEPIGELAIEGQRRSVAAGMGKRVPIAPVDIETLKLRERRYDAIYTRERLFAVAEKNLVLDQMAVGLKERGQILITDFLRPDDPGAPPARAITKPHGAAAHFWTMTQYRRALQDRGFQIYLAQDITEEYLDQLRASWAAVPDVIRRERLNHHQVSMIMQEGEVWLERSRAMAAGEIVLGRLHAQLT